MNVLDKIKRLGKKTVKDTEFIIKVSHGDYITKILSEQKILCSIS